MQKVKVLWQFLWLFPLLGCFAQENERAGWTRFRGADGMGIDSLRSLPLTWESTAYSWKIPLPGTGHSSPVVWDYTIFVTSADDARHLGYVTAVDEQEGKILWQKEFGVTGLDMHEDNNLASATPAVDESQIYVVWYARNKITLIALNHEGELQWQSEFPGIEARWGGGSSLALTDKLVIFTREQELGQGDSYKSTWVAVDKTTGQTAWALERESCTRNSFSTPIPVENGRGETQLIFTSEAHGFTGVDPETGRVLWENSHLLTHRVVASPVYAEGLIVGCRKGEAMVLEVDLDSHKVGQKPLYKLPPSLSPYVPTPLVLDHLLYLFMDNGSVACVKLESGKVLWKERPAGPLYGSPVCVGGILYCVTKAGRVLVLRAGPEYDLLGISDLGEGSFSTPVPGKSGMIFRTFSGLMLLEDDH